MGRVGSVQLKVLGLAGALLLLSGVSFGQTAAIDGSLNVHPFVGVPPDTIMNLSASTGALEGQVDLTWTAPAVYPGGILDSYQVRVQTFSVADAGGSTTAWWNNATGAQFQSFYGVNPGQTLTRVIGPAPADNVVALEPGATYYFAVRSADDLGTPRDFWSDLSNIASSAALDLPPPSPTGLAVVQSGTAAFTVSWSSVTAYDLDFYRLYWDLTGPYDFADASVVVVDSPTLSAVLTGLSTGTYHFRVTAVDKGAPSYAGAPLESVPSAEVVVELLPVVRPPQEPYGVAISTGVGGGVLLRWMPVTRFADGAAFAVSSAPASDELSGYLLYRASSPVWGTWSQVAAVSTSTLLWTDLAGGSQHYYHLRSQNATGLSLRSVVRSLGTLSAYIVAPDDGSVLEVLAKDVTPIEGVPADPDSAYLVRASSRSEDLGGRVLKSVEFKAWRGGLALAPDFAIAGMGWLRLHYVLSGSSVSPSGLGTAGSPGNMSVYWHNGRGWVQLYGKLAASDQTMIVQTKYFGRYQLRTVERTGGFAFNQAGVSNRLVTPNGDGKNDTVVFIYDNPRDSQVSVRLLDIRGKVVVSDLPVGPVSNSKVWDGTAGGRPVPGGVYIYQIESEGRVYSGTVVIVK